MPPLSFPVRRAGASVRVAVPAVAARSTRSMADRDSLPAPTTKRLPVRGRPASAVRAGSPAAAVAQPLCSGGLRQPAWPCRPGQSTITADSGPALPARRTWGTRDHDRPSTALAARLLRARFRRSRTRPGGWAPAGAGRAGRRLPPAARRARARARTRPGPTSARPRRPRLLRSGPPRLSATTGCATSRTSSPPGPTARCASASTWAVVVAGPAPASDTVSSTGCHNGCDAPHRR